MKTVNPLAVFLTLSISCALLSGTAFGDELVEKYPPALFGCGHDVTYSMSIANADIDEDGSLDLIVLTRCWDWVADPGGSEDFKKTTLSIFNLVDGALTLKSPSFDLPSPTANRIAVADLDNDGEKEIVVTGQKSCGGRWCGEISVYNYATGTFLEKSYFYNGTAYHYINNAVPFDYDNDGTLDLIVDYTTLASSPLHNFKHLAFFSLTGTNLVNEHSVPDGPGASSRAILADVTGDPSPELVTAGYDVKFDVFRNVASIQLWHPGEGNIDKIGSTWWESTTLANASSGVLGLEVSDLNNDGTPEIVTGGFDNDGSRIYPQLKVWNYSSGFVCLDTDELGAAASPTSITALKTQSGSGKKVIIAGVADYGHVTGVTFAAELKAWDFEDNELAEVASASVGSRITGIIQADVDNDGREEIVTIGSAYNGLIEEGRVSVFVFNADSDGDGVPDDQDICAGFDDNVDTDNDVVPDGCDPCPLDAENDADGDGVCGDVDVCPGGDDAVNADGDSLPDFCDACPLDPENDADGDGICESDDNCPAIANENQADLDGDGEGDVCDADIDGDGVENGGDNCVFDVNPGQDDFDGDGSGDVCDADIDGDDVVDADDACVPTPVGEVVSGDGCSIEELCPCTHLEGGDKWKNHGAYVSCVAHASEEFVTAGLISAEEKDAIVSSAAQSACGQKKK